MDPKTAFSKRGIAALALLCAAATPALGQQPTGTEQKQHVVKKGDTLWDIARTYFKDPYRWPLIFDANRKVVNNPHWIYPAETLVIPGERTPELLGQPIAQEEQPVAEAAPTPVSNRSRFYTPPAHTGPQPTLITSERDVARLVQPMEWLAAPWVQDSASLDLVAKVFKSDDPTHQRDRLPQTFHPQDKLYVSVLRDGLKVGDQLLAVRLTRKLGELGMVIEPQAILRVDSMAGSTALAFIVTQFAGLQTNDPAMMMPEVPPLPTDALTPVSGAPVGEIIDFLVDQPLVGTTEYAFVSLGAAQGIAIGDELVAFVPERVPDAKRPERLPEQPIARLRVIHVNQHVSTVRVIGLREPALVRGLLVRVARKAP